MEEHSIRLRPRAIVTTLVSRLLVADVFVHGIGGAAYDTITDDVVRRLIGSDPPRHAVVSGTLRLPLASAFPTLETADPAESIEVTAKHHIRRANKGFCLLRVAVVEDEPPTSARRTQRRQARRRRRLTVAFILLVRGA
jgi:hypothetical protein